VNNSESALDQFTRLTKEGRLKDVFDWIDDGNPIELFKGRYQKRVTALDLCAKSGFHSLVEEILKRVKWSSEDKASAVGWATRADHSHIVELLIEYGASCKEQTFDDFCRLKMDSDFLAKVVGAGCDPTRCDAFAMELSHTGAKPLLRFYKKHRDRIEGLDEQLNQVFRQSVQDKKLRTAILCLWAGADPTAKVPWELRYRFSGYMNLNEEDLEDDEDKITGYEALAFWSDLEFFEALNLKPQLTDVEAMLKWAVMRPDQKVLHWLIEQYPVEKLNDTDRNSSSLLEDLNSNRHYFEGKWSSVWDRTIEACEMLLSRGAHWNPVISEMGNVRRSMAEHPDGHFAKTIKLLNTHKQPKELIWEIIRTPKMRQKLWAGGGKGIYSDFERQFLPEKFARKKSKKKRQFSSRAGLGQF